MPHPTIPSKIATLRNFPSRSAAVLEQARVHPQDTRSKLNARHISLVAFASCSFASLLSFWVFIVVPRGGIYKQGCCRCSERLRAKAGGGESLAHTRSLLQRAGFVAAKRAQTVALQLVNIVVLHSPCGVFGASRKQQPMDITFPTRRSRPV